MSSASADAMASRARAMLSAMSVVRADLLVGRIFYRFCDLGHSPRSASNMEPFFAMSFATFGVVAAGAATTSLGPIGEINPPPVDALGEGAFDPFDAFGPSDDVSDCTPCALESLYSEVGVGMGRGIGRDITAGDLVARDEPGGSAGMRMIVPHLHLPLRPASCGFHGYSFPQDGQANFNAWGMLHSPTIRSPICKTNASYNIPGRGQE